VAGRLDALELPVVFECVPPASISTKRSAKTDGGVFDERTKLMLIDQCREKGIRVACFIDEENARLRTVSLHLLSTTAPIDVGRSSTFCQLLSVCRKL
jgi:hypothetical protein